MQSNIQSKLHSDDLTCDKCGNNTWKPRAYGGVLLSSPPLFVYLCTWCQKMQYFSFIHDREGHPWHEFADDEVVTLPSPELDAIRANPEKFKLLRKRLGLCPTIDVVKRGCDCCGKVTERAYQATVIMDGVEFTCCVHDASTGMKFCSRTIANTISTTTTTTTKEERVVVADVCNSGYMCRPHNLKSRVVMFIAKTAQYVDNNRYCENFFSNN